MEIEHITIKDLGNGYFQLTPDRGFKLQDKNGRIYSNAVTKRPKNFVAVAVE